MRVTWFPVVGRREVAIFAALVVLLLAPWPRWGRVFGAFFSAYGNGLVSGNGVGGPAPPRFGAPAAGEVGPGDGGDWAVVLRSEGRAIPLDTRIIGYTPLAIFVALALATPAPRRRKAKVLLGGLAVLLARLAFAVLVPVSSAYGGASSSLGQTLWTVLITPPVMSYAAPLTVWWLAFALTTPAGRASDEPSSDGRLRKPGRGARAPHRARGAARQARR